MPISLEKYNADKEHFTPNKECPC